MIYNGRTDTELTNSTTTLHSEFPISNSSPNQIPPSSSTPRCRGCAGAHARKWLQLEFMYHYSFPTPIPTTQQYPILP